MITNRKLLINRREFKERIISLFLLCLIAVTSGSALQVTLLSGFITYSIEITALFCAIPIILRLRNKGIGAKEVFFLIHVVGLLVNSLFYPSDISLNIFRICIFVIAFYVTERYTPARILNTFVIFSVFVAATAIVGSFLQRNTLLLDALPEVKNINGVLYKIGIIYNYIVIAPDRICGFFWEPGLLGTCMVYAVVIYGVFCVERIRLKELIILSLLLWCCFSAKSSAAYVLGVFSIASLFFKKSEKYQLRGITSILQFILFFVLMIAVANYEVIIASLSPSNSYWIGRLSADSINSSMRMLSVTNNMLIWIDNPIVGVGIQNATKMGQSLIADTSTSTFLLAAYGIVGIGYTVAIIYGCFRQKRLPIFLRMIMCVTMLLIVNKEPHFSNLFTWILIFLLLGNTSETME